MVVRFLTDNPGVWFLHCHIDLHNTNGMGMLINEAKQRHPRTPTGFPVCNSYFNDGSGKYYKADSDCHPLFYHLAIYT